MLIQKNDPLTRQVEKRLQRKECSPMDPPAAYDPPAAESVCRSAMHPYLKRFMDEHDLFKKELEKFEQALTTLQEHGLSKACHETIRHFFHYFDHEISAHSRREEKTLFPLLHKRLIEKGEHSQGAARATPPTTPIDVLEGDHVKMLQMAALTLNFMGLSSRLPDAQSCLLARLLVLDAAIQQGKGLVELLRLHMFREDTVLFPLAHHTIASDEFQKMVNMT